MTATTAAPAAAAAAANSCKPTKKSTKKAHRHVAKRVRRGDEAYSTLRKSCAPGTIAIVLAGRFRGRRVVILKQLPHNGPLVITGPMKYNGVPLRRIDARYVIATSTKIDISGVDTQAITTSTFARPKPTKPVKSEEHFMGDKAKAAAERRARKTTKAASAAKTAVVSDERAQLQKSIDAALIEAIRRDAQGKEKAGYLRSVFTIKPGDTPHRWNW